MANNSIYRTEMLFKIFFYLHAVCFSDIEIAMIIWVGQL